MQSTERNLTALEHFQIQFRKNPDVIYLNQPIQGQWHRFTYQRVWDEACAVATYIRSLNLPRGSRIATVSKNCAHWIITDLAIMLSGNVSVPLYPNINGKTVRFVLEHSDAKLLFVGKLDDWNEVKSGIPSGLKSIAFPLYGPPELQPWDSILGSSLPENSFQPIQPEELLTVIYTSGTTGNPKGVMLSSAATSFAVTSALTQIDLGRDRHRQFSYLPLSHIAERMFVEFASFWLGSEVWFAESLDLFAKNLQEAKPTIFIGVPRIWTKFQMGILSKLPQSKLDVLLRIPVLNKIIETKVKKGLGLEKCRHFFTGAAPIAPTLLDWFEKLNMPIQEVYAMTENCAYSHFTRAGKRRRGSVGQAMPEVQVRIGDNNEIITRSRANMLGYYKEPELTAAALKDGWLHTGDTGTVDEVGFLKITGRVKEIFKTDKGKYVSPTPIEMQLCKAQEIEQICVVGANLPQPMGLIVLSLDAREAPQEEVAARLTETLNEVNAGLESHERLKGIVLVKEEWTVNNNLLTPSMKVKRAQVEEKYSTHLSVWYGKKEIVLWE